MSKNQIYYVAIPAGFITESNSKEGIINHTSYSANVRRAKVFNSFAEADAAGKLATKDLFRPNQYYAILQPTIE